MDIWQRDELFRKRQENREKYGELIRKNQEFEADFHKYFVDNKDVILNKDMDIYKRRLTELNKEKQELDSEWEKLNQELYQFIFPNSQK